MISLCQRPTLPIVLVSLGQSYLEAIMSGFFTIEFSEGIIGKYQRNGHFPIIPLFCCFVSVNSYGHGGGQFT